MFCSSPKCAGLMLFRVPNAPDLCFFDSQMRRTYAFSSPKCAGLMLPTLPTPLPSIELSQRDPNQSKQSKIISLALLGSKKEGPAHLGLEKT